MAEVFFQSTPQTVQPGSAPFIKGTDHENNQKSISKLLLASPAVETPDQVSEHWVASITWAGEEDQGIVSNW